MQMMKIRRNRSFFRHFLPILLLLFPFASAASAQSSHVLYGEGAFGLTVRPSWDTDGEWQGFDASFGQSLAGIMDIGVNLSCDPFEEEDFSGTRFTTAVDLRAYLLKQGLGVPLSLFVEGSYGIVNTISDDLNDLNLHQHGSLLTGGGGAETILPLSRRFALHAGGAVSFRALRLTTRQDEDQPENPRYPLDEYDDSLRYRGYGGVHFRFTWQTLLALEAAAEWDGDFALRSIGPRLSLLFLSY